MSLDARGPPCESLRVIADVCQTVPSRPSLRSRQARVSRAGRATRGVIVFPLFDHYGDQIRDWLAKIGDEDCRPEAVARIVRSIRRTAGNVERVRNSQRHRNLASFLLHAANALEASEREGARYILAVALAVPDFAFREEEKPGLAVRQNIKI
jgi:hypothetical protein